MANKKINQLDFRTGVALTDLLLIGDPTTGTSYKLTGTDFKTLLGFVPYTGATSNVNLGEFGLATGQVTLDTTPTGTAAVGTTRWNDTIGSSETTLKGGSVVLKNGVDLVARIVNKVSPNTTLTKANYQAVRVSGAQGQRLAVAFAQANNDANSADTIGLVCETIATNQEGFIITMGQLENINTTGSLQGETWADGDVLYLSPTTPGAITKVKPTGNGHIVVIGYVEYAHANNGKIYVKVMNGWELDELHDVDIVSPANNEALIYESSTQLWKNKTIATALGYTPISGSGVTGQVAYWNGTNSQTGSNNFLWDNTNNRLTVGGNITSDSSVGFRFVGGDSLSARLGVYNTNKGGVFIGSISGSASIYGYNYTSGSSLSLQLQEFGGNVLIGGTTNGGQRLQVYGDAFVRGSGNTSATFSLTIQDSASANILRVRNDKTLIVNSTDTYNGSILAGANVSGRVALLGNLEISSSGGPGWSGQGIEVVGANRTLKIFGTSSLNALDNSRVQFANPGAPWTRTSGISNDVEIQGSSFAPTSGNATYTTLAINQTINQTGGANGITRGLYVNPTITAAADWRSIEWSNNSGWGLYGAGTANNYLGGSLGIGTTTPGNILEIARNQNASTTLIISNTTNDTIADTRLRFKPNAGSFEMGKYSMGATVYKIFLASDSFFYNGFNGDISMLNDHSTGRIKFAAGGSSTAQMTLTAAGRLLLGLTAESTFLLDVNGTARVSGNLTLGTTPTIQSTTGNIIISSVDAPSRKLTYDTTNNTLAFTQFGTQAFIGERFYSVSDPNTFVSPNGLNSVGSAKITAYDSSGNAAITASNNGNRSIVLNGLGSTGSVLIGAITTGNGTSYNAILRADSTTQGFLPPRMTTTQKNAIASPTAGLMVYDTTLNKLCVYTTAWETITSI